MDKKSIKKLRREIDKLNIKVLKVLNERAKFVNEIGELKSRFGIELFDPEREHEMLEKILKKNKGPFTNETVKNLFKEIFKASLNLMDETQVGKLKVSRKYKIEDTVVKVRDVSIGKGKFIVIAGPCSIESYNQLDEIADFLSRSGIKILRGGAYKPRTSPYTFQGLREKGLRIFKEVTDKYNMASITEVVDTRDVKLVSEYSDILQIGTRNMFNYELLKLVGRTDKPILLKRGFMATMEEFLLAAEYIIMEGNGKIILCERGIRTFERWTRNTLDISCVPILKQESHLPVVVDLSHATGRKDIILPLAKASVAAGSNGIMLEVHNNPPVALSDSEQQLNFDEFDSIMKNLK